MQHLAHTRHRSFAGGPGWLLLPALVALAGCSSDAMNLGSNELAVEVSECRVDLIEGDITASSQEDIDALRGCRELPGSLTVITPEGAPGSISLEPLAELWRVGGPLRISGPITSLAGLESLESVGVLDLRDTALTDLLPLRSLTRVDTMASWPVYGARIDNGIQIDNCDQLGDLHGLESLTTWGSLLITESDGLVSLAGLQAPERVETIDLIDMPQLGDVSALAPVRFAGFIGLSGTAVTGFEELSLERAETLSLTQNPALTDLNGLSRLEEVGELYIDGNDALVRMALPRFHMYNFVSITGNPALLTLLLQPAGGWAWTGRTSSLENVPLGFQRRMFEVGDNPRVTNITLTDGLDIEEVVIYRNASLTSLSLPLLRRTDTLWLQDNAALASVEVPQLERVSTLTILDNPALSVAPFAGVQTFQSELTGNLDTLDP